MRKKYRYTIRVSGTLEVCANSGDEALEKAKGCDVESDLTFEIDDTEPNINEDDNDR